MPSLTTREAKALGVRRAAVPRDRQKKAVVVGSTMKPPNRAARPEREVMKAILAYLKTRLDVTAWRQNAGMMRGEHKGKRWVVRMGFPGLSDIGGWVRWCSGCGKADRSCEAPYIHEGTESARPLYIECKREGEVPTALQRAFLDLVRSSGGLAVVAYEVSDVVKALEGR